VRPTARSPTRSPATNYFRTAARSPTRSTSRRLPATRGRGSHRSGAAGLASGTTRLVNRHRDYAPRQPPHASMAHEHDRWEPRHGAQDAQVHREAIPVTSRARRPLTPRILTRRSSVPSTCASPGPCEHLLLRKPQDQRRHRPAGPEGLPRRAHRQDRTARSREQVQPVHQRVERDRCSETSCSDAEGPEHHPQRRCRQHLNDSEVASPEQPVRSVCAARPRAVGLPVTHTRRLPSLVRAPA
jgi:hypothetical protein